MKVVICAVVLLSIAGNASALTGEPILDEHGPARLTHTMARGSVSDDVALLRRMLVRAGVAGRELVEVTAPDVFDADVEAAVKRFQMSYGLVTDGRKKRPPLGPDHRGYGKLGKVTRQGLNLQQEEAPSWAEYNARVWQARAVYLACRGRDASDSCLGELRRIRTLARRRARDFGQLLRFWPEAALAVSLSRPSPVYGGELFATGLPAPGSPEDLQTGLWGWIEREGSLDADVHTLNVDDFDVGASGTEITDTTSGRSWPDTSAALAGAKRAIVPGLLYGEGEDATIAPTGPATVTQLVDGLQPPEAALTAPAASRTTEVIVILLNGVSGFPLTNTEQTIAATYQQVNDWFQANSRGLHGVSAVSVRKWSKRQTNGCFGAPDIEGALTPQEWAASGNRVIAVIDPSINGLCPYGGVTQNFFFAGRYHWTTMLADYSGTNMAAIATHELGHALGLGHSGACSTTWDRRGLCSDVAEYGDPVSVMGVTYGFPNVGLGPVHASQLGWFGASDFIIANSTMSTDLNTAGKTVALVGRAPGAQPSSVAYWLEHLAFGWYVWVNPPPGVFVGSYVTEISLPAAPSGGFNLRSGESWTDGYGTTLTAVGASTLRVTRGGPQPTPQPTATPAPGQVSCWFTSSTHNAVVTGALTTLNVHPGERIQVRADSSGGAYSDLLAFGGPASNTNPVQPWPFLDYSDGPRSLTWQHGGDFHVTAPGVYPVAWTVYAANGSSARCVLQIVATQPVDEPICHIVAPDHIGVGVPFSPSWNLDVGQTLWSYGWSGPIDKISFLICGANVPCQIGPAGMWGNLRFTQAGVASVVLEARNGNQTRICTMYVSGE